MDDAALKSVALLLDDAAMAWWHTYRADIATWDVLKLLFTSSFNQRSTITISRTGLQRDFRLL